MRRASRIGVCLLVALAMSAVAAATASASEYEVQSLPELGRCVKVAPVTVGHKTHYEGAYSNKTCTKRSKKTKGKYEWLSGPGANNKFVAEASAWTFETEDGAKIECGPGVLSGAEFTGPKTEKFSGIELSDCATGFGKSCQTNPEAPNTIDDPDAVEGELGMIKKKAVNSKVGWDLKGVKFLFTCGKAPEVEDIEIIEGSVIGTALRGEPGDVDRMGSLTAIHFKATEAAQSPEMFEGGVKDTLTTTTVVGISKTEEQTGLTGEALSKTFGEPLEIRTKE